MRTAEFILYPWATCSIICSSLLPQVTALKSSTSQKSCDSRRIFSWGWSNLAYKCLDGFSKHCFKALLSWGLLEVINACWIEDEAALRCLWDVSLFSLGAGSRLESVGEDDELMVENGESSYEIAVKYSRGGRKHSLPQQLESAGARQVGAKPEREHGQDGKCSCCDQALNWMPWDAPPEIWALKKILLLLILMT